VSGEISIDTDLLRTHAARVDATADGIAEAVSAARSLNLADGAFGLLCAFMVPPIGMVAQVATTALDSAQNWVDTSASQVRAAATDFDTFERNLADQLRTAARELS